MYLYGYCIIYIHNYIICVISIIIYKLHFKCITRINHKSKNISLCEFFHVKPDRKWLFKWFSTHRTLKHRNHTPHS